MSDLITGIFYGLLYGVTVTIVAVAFGVKHRCIRCIACEEREQRINKEIENLTHRCQVPPKGWRCTREPGHEGPCAALPEE